MRHLRMCDSRGAKLAAEQLQRQSRRRETGKNSVFGAAVFGVADGFHGHVWFQGCGRQKERVRSSWRPGESAQHSTAGGA